VSARAKPAIDIIEAVRDPNILGDTLSDAQEAALRAMYGLPLEGRQLEIAEQCAGKAWKPGVEQGEAAFICGRRSGKSDKLAANIAIYEAFFREHRLSPGETGVILLLAQNMRQAKVVRDYIEGKVRKSPILSQHVQNIRANEIELENRITIAIHPSSFRAIRGLSVVCCVCDEIAFWWTEDSYANPDVEVLRAVRPAMATFPHAKLVLVSSPYAMNGVLWDLWRRRDEDSDVLIWHAPTRLMNPTVRETFLARAKRQDPDFYAREYEAEFAEAVSGFLPAIAIEAAVVRDRESLPPEPGHVYVSAMDAAFKGDRFTFCICHIDSTRNKLIIDLLLGWQGSPRAPLSTQQVLPEMAKACRRYGIGTVFADQFGAAPLADVLAGWGLRLEEVPFTSQSKQDIYGTLRSLLVDGCLELLDHRESLSELRGLEIELLPAGASRIGHGSGGHDDYADALALAVFQAMELGVPVEFEIHEDENFLDWSLDDWEEHGPHSPFRLATRDTWWQTRSGFGASSGGPSAIRERVER